MTTPKNQSDDLNDLIKHLDELVVEFSDVAKEMVNLQDDMHERVLGACPRTRV